MTTVKTQDGQLTKKADKRGVEVYICHPTWLEATKKYRVTNAPDYASSLEFTGDDLNFAARVLYAEATGSKVGVDEAELAKEKQAILHVMYFRLNRKGYPSSSYVAKSFTSVGKAPRVQFESVFNETDKFLSTNSPDFQSLKKADCSDLQKCIDAVKTFIEAGPDFSAYPYDSFKSAKSRPKWQIIAKNAFSITKLGKSYLNEITSNE